MNRFTWKMLLRSIRGSLSRFLAIMAIVALGVGFYAGLRSSQPAMLNTVDEYLREQHMYDYQLLSSLGFTEGDIDAFRQMADVRAAEGTYFADVYAVQNGTSEVLHLASITQEVALPKLTAGRMPENDHECLADDQLFTDADLGTEVRLTDENDADTLDLLRERQFTIVGLARSPRYLSGDRGSTTLGSGTVRGVLFLPASCFDSEAYHELLLWCDLPGDIYSESYNEARDRLKPEIEEFLNRRGTLRYRDLRAEADAEIAEAKEDLAEGRRQYRVEKAKAERELKEAERKLKDGQAELDEARKTLEANQRQLDELAAGSPAARAEIAKQRALLQEKEAELIAGRAEAEVGRQQLLAGQAELIAGKALLAAQKEAELAGSKAAVAAATAEILALQGILEQLRTDPEGNAAAITAMEASIASQQQAAADAQKALDAKQAEVDAKYADQEAEIAAGEAELNAATAELNAALVQIREGENAIAVGKVQLEAAELELDAAEQTLPQSRAQLQTGWDEYNTGVAKLEAGRAEYNSGKAEAEQKFKDAEAEMADAEQKIAEAETELEDKLQLDLYTLDRSANAGYVTFESDSEIVDAIAVPFPLFFVLIVALVCITTMTRMVSEERTQIGTMKALGYSGAAIAGKYLLYAGISALIGCVIGFFLGCTVLPYIIWYAYQIMYTYDTLLFYYSVRMCLFCILIAVAGTVGSAWLACRQQLAERPAELIRPKAPPVGKRVFLEYITPLWSRLPFLSKVTLRNAFRYPLRVLMMLLGIGGCTALLVTGFGIRDSVEEISAYQYEEIFLYDLTVSYDEADLVSRRDVSSLWRDCADAWALTCQEPVVLRDESGKEKSTTLVAAEKESLEQVISLHKGSEPVAFPGPGEAVITQKLADVLNVSVGDRLIVTPDDAPSFSVTVSGVCDNYIGHFIYVSSETAGSPANNTALVRAASGVDSGKLAASLRSEDGVLYVQLSQTSRDTIENSMASIDLVVVLIVACSGALAFITLYNLTNINILERIREVATVKVLGFFPSETARYILSENLLLSFLGAVLGIAAGKYLHRFILLLVRIENMLFDVRIAPLSYVLSFVITLIFALLTNLFMRRRLEAVSMTESLKSVE